MPFLYKGQLCKFALHLDFPRKSIFIFKLGAISLLIMLQKGLSLSFFFSQKGLFTVLGTEITTITKLTATATIIGGVITVTCYCVFHYLLYYDYHNSFIYIMSFTIYSKSERYCYLNFKNEKPKVQRAKSLA